MEVKSRINKVNVSMTIKRVIKRDVFRHGYSPIIS